MSSTGANLTPDKFPVNLRSPLEALCDQHLIDVANALQVEWIIGIGGFARACAERVRDQIPNSPAVGTILHPSPASPISNREWPHKPIRQMQELGLW